MIRYLIETIKTDVLDVSSINKKERIPGNTLFKLQKWDDNLEKQIFSTSETTVSFSDLTVELQDLWQLFQQKLIDYISKY